jgi:putative membrane protein
MGAFLVRLLIGALSLWIASILIPGMEISGPGTLLAAAFLLGLVNALVRPVLILLTLPFTLATLGFFLLVINAAMLGLVAWLLPGFVLRGFFPALFGSIAVSLFSWFTTRYIGTHERY